MFHASQRLLGAPAAPGADRGVRAGIGAWIRRAARLALLCVILSPTLAAVAYFGFVAADRYVSEARFVVRTASRPQIGGGLASLLQMTGISRTQDDAFAVHDFIESRAAVSGMPADVDLRAIYGSPRADAVARYPNFYYGSTEEELRAYLRWMIGLRYNPNTGITTLNVQAFSAEEARRIAQALLGLSEEVVNRINMRIREDAIRLAAEEVKRAEERVIASQVAITDFRNREAMLDPARSSIIVSELIARLSAELAQTRAALSEMIAGAPDNPQVAGLRRRADALETQIASERARIGSASDGLADKIAQFERLSAEKEFAMRILATSITSLEASRLEARRQQLYLQKVVEPTLPDQAQKPERVYNILLVFAANLILALVGWLLRTGVKAHGFSMDD